MNFLSIESPKNSFKWFTELKKAFDKETLDLYELPETLLEGSVTFAGKGSLSGIQMEVVENSLRVYTLSYPSEFDIRIFKALVKHFDSLDCRLMIGKEEENDLDAFFESKKYVSNDQPETLIRDDKSISLLTLQSTCVGKSKVSRDRFMIDAMHNLSMAKQVEIYPVDGKSSFIWDGAPAWVSGKLEQILFSQKAFKGKLCGVISLQEFQKVLGDRLLSDDNGTLIPSSDVLGKSDFDSMNMHMEKFEGARKPVKPEKLSITAGRLEEISYGMAKAIFSGKPLKDYNESLLKEGLSQGQLEVAGLAVSSMLEIAATSKGQSLADMTGKLKEKSSLTNEAAYAVANGFFKAAKEEPEKKKNNSGKIIFVIGLAVILYLIFK